MSSVYVLIIFAVQCAANITCVPDAYVFEDKAMCETAGEYVKAKTNGTTLYNCIQRPIE